MIVKNLSNDKFGMCPICNRAKWSHTNEQEISCTEDMLKVSTIKNLKEQLEQLKMKLKHAKKKTK
jgi:hypothetical protein